MKFQIHFLLKFVNNETAQEMNVNDALIAVGFSGSTPIPSLESRFMATYNTFDASYILAHDIIKDQGEFGKRAAEIKTFIAGNGIVLSNDADNFTISANLTNKDYQGPELLDETTQEIRILKPSTSIGILVDNDYLEPYLVDPPCSIKVDSSIKFL